MVYTRNKGIFIILSYLYTPTSDKKVQQNENVEFVDRLKNRHYNSATVILDMINKKFIKNRTENKSFLSIVEHVRKGYPKEFQSLLEITKLESEYKSEPEEIALEAEEVLKEIEVFMEDGDLDVVMDFVHDEFDEDIDVDYILRFNELLDNLDIIPTQVHNKSYYQYLDEHN